MGLQRASAAKKPAGKKGNETQLEKADAWLKMALVDNNGGRHNLRRDMAAYIDQDKVLKAMYQRELANQAEFAKIQEQNPSLEYAPRKFTFEAWLYIPVEKPEVEIPL
jgi:hypothetical protein